MTTRGYRSGAMNPAQGKPRRWLYRFCMPGLIGLLLFSLLAGMSAPVADAAGTTYYVDAAQGSDTNPGTGETAAWKTLGKVNSVTFSPGTGFF